MITYSKLTREIQNLIHEADIQTDNHGQIIIYTGLKLRSHGSDHLMEVDSHCDDCAKVQCPGCTDPKMCDCGLEGNC